MNKIKVFGLLVFVCIVNLYAQDSLRLAGVPTWNQIWPYNRYCPVDAAAANDIDLNGRCPAGCVAVAVAQLLKYYNYPARGLGSVSYVGYSNQTLSMNFDTCVFDWAKMPQKITGTSTLDEQESVARLIYTVGLMLRTSYTPLVSVAHERYLIRQTSQCLQLGGNTFIRTLSELSSGQRDSLLVQELLVKRPVLLKADYETGKPGHMIVVDGYVKRSGKLIFHVNGGDGTDGIWCSLDSIHFGGKIFDKNLVALLPCAPASLPVPENFSYAVQDSILYVGWDPVSEPTVCGYKFFNWTDTSNSRIWYPVTAVSHRVTMAILDLKDVASVKRFIHDDADSAYLNLVAIKSDSTASIQSNTLTIPRDQLILNMGVQDHEMVRRSDDGLHVVMMHDKLWLKMPIARKSHPLEVALFCVDGTRFSARLQQHDNFVDYSIVAKDKVAPRGPLLVQVKMSDGRTIVRKVTSLF